MPALLHGCRLQSVALIDVDWSSNRDHRVEALDILVAHAHAAMADGLADRLGLVRPVNCVAVAHLEAACPEHSHVAAGGRSERRNDDIAAADYLASFGAATERHRSTIGVALDDFSAAHADDAVARGDRLARGELDHSESTLVRQLDEVPVGRNPRWILFLRLYTQAAARRLEPPLPPAGDELFAASRCDRCLEEDLGSLLEPQHVVSDADDEIRRVGRFGRRVRHQPLEAVAGHTQACFHLVQNPEVVVVDHTVDVALVAQLRGLRKQRDAQNGCDDKASDQEPDCLPTVRKDPVYCHLDTPFLVIATGALRACNLNRSIPSYRP